MHQPGPRLPEGCGASPIFSSCPAGRVSSGCCDVPHAVASPTEVHRPPGRGRGSGVRCGEPVRGSSAAPGSSSAGGKVTPVPARRSPCAPASTPLLNKDSDHVHWGLPASTMTRSRPRPQRACSHRRPRPGAPGLGLQQGKAAFPGHDSARSSG